MFGKLGMVPDGDHNDIYENMCQRLHLCTSLQVHARNGLLRSWGLACNTLRDRRRAYGTGAMQDAGFGLPRTPSRHLGE